MKTTAVFAEILTVGLQALVWMAMAGWVIADWAGASTPNLDEIKRWLAAASDWSALITLFALAMAYTTGVFVDRIADTVMGTLGKFAKRVGKWLLRPRESEADPRNTPFSLMRLQVRYRGGEMGSFLDYVRSRLRIARGSVFNLMMASIFGGLILSEFVPLTFVLSVAVVSLALAVFGWMRIEGVYDRRLSQAYKIIQADETLRSSSE